MAGAGKAPVFFMISEKRNCKKYMSHKVYKKDVYGKKNALE